MADKTRKEVCDQIAEDVKNDAVQFDGKPFNGKTVAEYFGYHGAAIAALAEIVKSLIDENESLRIELGHETPTLLSVNLK